MLVAERLGLPDPTGAQDWGIEFSDPERLDDFVAFAVCEMSAGWHPELVREFVDLLLQSADDRLREDPTIDLAELRRWLSREMGLLETALAYWLTLSPHDDWPVVAWLKSWGVGVRVAPETE
jgi:hypothetical protein